MRITDVVTRAGRSLRQAKARTLLTSFAIAVGAFTLTLALAAGEGARQYADDLISSNTDTRELFISKTSQQELFDIASPKEYSEDAGRLAGGQISVKRLTQNDLDSIRAQEGVSEVTPAYRPTITYITRDGQKKFTGNIEMFGRGSTPDIAAGTVSSDGTMGDDEIIISDKYREALGFSSDAAAVGQIATIHLKRQTPRSEVDMSVYPPRAKLIYDEKDIKLRVLAVSKQGANALTAPSPLFISSETAKSLSEYMTKDTSDYQKYIGAVARVDSSENIETVQKKIRDLGYQAESAKDLQGVLFTIVNVLQGITIGFGALAIIASVFGIINTQYISVLERTQQIGLMKALGMRRRDVSRLFRFEAAWIGFLGGCLGALLAWSFGSTINPWLSDTIGLGDQYLLVFQLPVVILLVLALMVVAITAGILPARKAAKLDPIEALRTE